MTLESGYRSWSQGDSDGAAILLQGDQRAYLTRPHATRSWADIAYDRLRLLGRTLHVTIDVSNTGCGCNAALYLVSMREPLPSGSSYCDIQAADPRRCLEIDLFEGNLKSAVATLHTQKGQAADGTCNQWGCAAGWGPADENCKFGRGSPNVDSSRPFELSAHFDGEGHMEIAITQDGQRRQLWDVASAGNGASAVPEDASIRVKAALTEGMVLVASLWGAEGSGMSWLDGGCSAEYPHCVLDDATARFRNLWIEGPDPSPWPPPPPSPSAPSPAQPPPPT
eukprot:3103216-Prymnesium_polylepis.1